MVIANTNPAHVATPKSWAVAIPATANTNRDGTGTITDIFSPGASVWSLGGSLKVKATGTTTAGMIRVFGYDGTAYRLLMELGVAAVTPSATVQTATAGSADSVLTADGYLVLNMPIGGTVAGTIQKIGISTHNAEAFVAHVKGEGDFQ